jgi:NTP pyrophosphatase (non-canonical NTP hydrolase)
MKNNKTYFLYHIPGKKIGVTCNLNSRVTEQQGYTPDEYEVLLTSDDIDYISDMEIELQKAYGYRVDRQLYKNLYCNKFNKFNQMNINATLQTSTFPCPLNKLKGNLMDSMGEAWDTPHGTFTISPQTIPWILENARTSMYNVERCYVYNKAFSAAFNMKETEIKPEKSVSNIYDLIRQWAKDKGIYAKGDPKTQYLKLMEEAGELSRAILKKDKPEIIDAIGDMVVVLTNLAELEGLAIEDCITSAYNVIKNRKGKMVNGTFVKQDTITSTLTEDELSYLNGHYAKLEDLIKFHTL